MRMATLNFALPEAMKEWVESQVHGGSYGNVSEYIRELIRQDQRRKTEERLESLLLEGLNSGNAGPMTKKDWNALRRKVAQRLAKRSTNGRKATGR